MSTLDLHTNAYILATVLHTNSYITLGWPVTKPTENGFFPVEHEKTQPT